MWHCLNLPHPITIVRSLTLDSLNYYLYKVPMQLCLNLPQPITIVRSLTLDNLNYYLYKVCSSA